MSGADQIVTQILTENFIPAQEYADKVIEHLEFDGRELTEVLAICLFPDDRYQGCSKRLQRRDLDRHLNMNIHVLDDTGSKLGSGRNIEVLRKTWAREVDQSFQNRCRHSVEQEGLTNWTFGNLPEQVEFKYASMKVKGFPALVDKGESVAIEIMDNQQAAVQMSNDGLLRLIRLQLKEQEKYVIRNIEQLRFSMQSVATVIIDVGYRSYHFPLYLRGRFACSVIGIVIP